MPGPGQLLDVSPGLILWAIGLTILVVFCIGMLLFYKVLRGEDEDLMVLRALTHPPREEMDVDDTTGDDPTTASASTVEEEEGGSSGTAYVPATDLGARIPAEWREEFRTAWRWFRYVLVAEVLLLGVALILDVSAGPSASGTGGAHMIAGLLGALAVTIAMSAVVAGVLYLAIIYVS